METFLVGRQPIFDERREVFGYELLFRGAAAERRSGDAMTADVLVRSALDVGLRSLVGERMAFVNATRPYLIGDQDIPFPPERTVVEVLEDVTVDEAVLEGCRELVEQGFRIALDDYAVEGGDEPLLELASIVKLDVLALAPDRLAALAERCRRFETLLVAEKVETPEQLEQCRELGFDLFQGYLLSRPEVVSGRGLLPRQLACLRLLELLADPELSPSDVEGIVQADPALSFRFLRAAGEGAAGGLRRPVGSIREGVVLLGLRRLRSWVMLMVLADEHAGPLEQLAIAMTRARMAELMAASVAPRRQDAAYTVGLVSALDVLLDVPLEVVVEELTLTEELVEALVHESGVLGSILADVRTWERAEDGFELVSGLDPATVERAYLGALAWSTELCAQFGAGTQERSGARAGGAVRHRRPAHSASAGRDPRAGARPPLR